MYQDLKDGTVRLSAPEHEHIPGVAEWMRECERALMVSLEKRAFNWRQRYTVVGPLLFPSDEMVERADEMGFMGHYVQWVWFAILWPWYLVLLPFYLVNPAIVEE